MNRRRGHPGAERGTGAPAADWGLWDCTVRFETPAAAITALDSVSLAVPHGEVTAVVGGDGAGKTTLLRTLARRIVPLPGRVETPEPRRIGFMSSASGVWRDLTVDENVEFVGRAYGMSGARLAARRAELLRRADLLGAADRLAGRLSGGMRQKLGFCLALLHEPELVILDEPTTGVDPVSRVELWRMIAETAASDRALVMSTTYLDEAERAASVLVLDEGHALYTGAPAAVTAAVPGVLARAGTRPAEDVNDFTWRRGREFHTWYPDTAPASASAEAIVTADLEDAVIALTLAHGRRPPAAPARQGGEEPRPQAGAPSPTGASHHG